MQHLSIRFLIGLASSSDPRPPPDPSWVDETAALRADTALAILSTHYPAFSAHRGEGYWQGAPEPNLVVEAIVDLDDSTAEGTDDEGSRSFTAEVETGRAQSVAGEIARALDQESVALAIGPVRFTLEGPHATEG